MMTNQAWPMFDPDKNRWDEFKDRIVNKVLRMGANESDVTAIWLMSSLAKW
jgi:transposase-like protein